MATIQETFSNAVRLHKGGYLPPAEELYRQVIGADPSHVHALSNLGALLYQANRQEEAIEVLRRALALRPDTAEFHVNLGAALRRANDVAAAVVAYRDAVRLDPTAGHVHTALAQSLLDMGKVDEAREHALEAIRLQPDYAFAWSLLGELAARGSHVFGAGDAERLQALLAKGRHSAGHAAQLHFTLATFWQQQGNYDEAFRAYGRANDLKREVLRQAGRAFDRVQHRLAIDSCIATFTPEVIAQARSCGIPSERPVFVVGMIRSGTTLVEQILASHPQVCGCGELNDIDEHAQSFYQILMNGADTAGLQRLAGLYLERLARLCSPASVRAVDKMPLNFRHLGMIAVLFPRARVIHCRRDPLDVCVSAFVQNFHRLPYSTNLEDLGFFYREYERLMAHWRRVLPLPMHEVVYEELVANQERVSRELLAFCGLPWDDCCLAFHRNTRAVQTPSRLQVRQPIYTHAVGRWQHFAAHLQPLFEALGMER